MADITEPLQTDSLQTADSAPVGVGVLAIDQVESTDSAPAGIGALAQDSVQTSDSIDGYSSVTEDPITDSVQTADSADDSLGENITDSVAAADSLVDNVTVNEVLVDQVEVADSSAPLWSDLAVDELQTVDRSTPIFTDSAVDQVATDDGFPALEYTEVLVDQVATADAVSDATRWETVTDSVEVADSSSGARVVTEVVADSLQAVDLVTQFADLTEQLSDSVIVFDRALADAGSAINESITDQVRAVDAIYSPDENALCWVLNTETGAPYYFTNFGFTDLVEHAGLLFAAAPDGLYLLQGEDDEGVDIDSSLQTGFMDFDTAYKKRLPDIYFGYTGGDLECDVETYDQPNDIYTYGMDARDAEAPRNNRIQLGKGLESRYWRLTLRNIAGAAFQVYDTVANVVASKRRL